MGATGGHEDRGPLTRRGALVYGRDLEITRWVAGFIPGFVVNPDARAIGVIKGGKLVAGVVYERWNGVHLEVSIAAETGSRWADRSTLFGLFHYPFGTLNCRAISVMVSTNNLPSLNLATKLGFTPEAILRFAAMDGADLIILKMFREQCRWIQDGQRQGRQSTEST